MASQCSQKAKHGILGLVVAAMVIGTVFLTLLLLKDGHVENKPNDKTNNTDGCLTGNLTLCFEGECFTRLIMVCENSSTLIGENHHELWWDARNKYWFCGLGYRQGMKELNENGITLPFNLSSSEDRIFYKTELPRKAIFPKDEINVRLEYAKDSNNAFYSNQTDIDTIIIIVEGRNDPMALAPGNGKLKWEINEKYGYYIDMEMDIRFNITGLTKFRLD